MASYVDSVLAAGETIIHRAAISHWKYALSYLVGLVLIVAGLAGFAVSTQREYYAAGTIAAALGLLLILVALIRRQTTELVLTDRRIITKRGLIARDTVEMNLTKVESIHVN